ncbi:MAG: hypothetical protein HYX47_05685 [Burkholderiales bacterium]|nr:hypothetical protein [Burkholderiales bacterium]
MKTVIVRYKTKPECADENQALIARVFEALAKAQPAGLRYQAMRETDGCGFVHVASVEGGIDNPLMQVPEFKAFLAGIRERCEEQPATVQMNVVGRYPG